MLLLTTARQYHPHVNQFNLTQFVSWLDHLLDVSSTRIDKGRKEGRKQDEIENDEDKVLTTDFDLHLDVGLRDSCSCRKRGKEHVIRR